MNYQEIKCAIRVADENAQSGCLSLANDMIHDVLREGGTMHDIQSIMAPESLKALRKWARKQAKA